MITYLIVYGLAVWRISSILVKEDGPFFVFSRFREWIGIGPVASSDRFLPQVLSCVWCTSVWISIVFVVLAQIQPYFSLLLALIFAVSALAIFCEVHLSGR